MFLGTAGIIAYCATRLAFWINIAHLELTVNAIASIVPVLRCVVDFCIYMRVVCPLAVLGAAAADLRVECRQKVQQACLRRRPLHSEYWRALRQRQHLIHDILCKFSDANGLFLLMLLVYDFLVITPTLGAVITTTSVQQAEGRVVSTDILYMSLSVAALCLCQWPAYEVQLKNNTFQQFNEKRMNPDKSATLTFLFSHNLIHLRESHSLRDLSTAFNRCTNNH